MDEEEKVFPIEIIIFLIVIAIANDIAEIFFDLLDFTGVGIAGEGIMEPINLALDFFFTAVFIWKVGPGGPTITQYIDDLLEPLLIPGRTISVGVGIWIANHPQSAVGGIATQVAQLEGGGVGGEVGALNEAEVVASTEVGAEAQAAAGKLEGEAANGSAASESNTGKRGSSTNESGSSENEESSDSSEKTKRRDEMESAEERDPTENLQEQLLEPPKDDEFPQAVNSNENPEQKEGPRKVEDISAPRQQKKSNTIQFPNQKTGHPQADGEDDESYQEAA